MKQKKKRYASKSAIVFRAIQRGEAPGIEPEICSIRQANRSFPPEVASEFELDVEITRSQTGVHAVGDLFAKEAPPLPLLSPASLENIRGVVTDDMPELVFDAPSFHGRLAAFEARSSNFDHIPGKPGQETPTQRVGVRVLERPQVEQAPPEEAKEMAKLTRSFHSIRTIHSQESSDQIELSERPINTSDSSDANPSSSSLDVNEDVNDPDSIEDLLHNLAAMEIRPFQRNHTPIETSFRSSSPPNKSQPKQVDEQRMQKSRLVVLSIAVLGIVGVVGWAFL